MEVSGQKPPTSSDADEENQCEQCKDEGLIADAAGLCTDCNDYLCSKCIQLHKKFRGTKDHAVLEGQDMPLQKLQKSAIEQCPLHPREASSLYCISENVFGCIRCFREGHNTCDTGLIVDLCKGVETSDDMKDIEIAKEQQKKNVDQHRQDIQHYRQINSNCASECHNDFEAFRADVENMLDRLGELVSTDAGKQNCENEKKLDGLLESVNSLDFEMAMLFSEIDSHRKTKKMDRLFIFIMNNKDLIKRKGEIIHQRMQSTQIQRYRFRETSEIKQILQEMINGAAVEMSEIMIGETANPENLCDGDDDGIDNSMQGFDAR